MSAEEQQDLLDAAEEQSASLGTLQNRAGNQIEKILAAALSSTLPGILQAYRRYTSSLRPTDQPIDGAGTIYTPTGTGAQAEARRRALRAEIDRFSRQVDPAAIEDVARSVLDEAVDLGEQAAARFGAMQDLPMPPAARPTQDIRALASSITGRITSEADGFRSIMSQIISDSAVQGFPGRRVERVVIEAFQGDQLPDGTIKTRGMVQRAMFNIETEVSVVSLEHQMETIRKAGHRYVRWITAQDEKVCGFCASRHGKVYLSDQIRIPAHSMCRCMAVPVKPEDIGADEWFYKEQQQQTIDAYAKAHNLTPEEAAKKLQEYERKPTQFEKYAQPVDPKPVQAVWEPGQKVAPPPPPARTFKDELQERAAPLMQEFEKFRQADQKRLDRLDRLTTLTAEAQTKAFATNAKADVDAYLKLVEQKLKLITQIANSKEDAFQKLRKRMMETPLSDFDMQTLNRGLKISYGDPGPIGTVPTATVTKGTAKDLRKDAKVVMGQRDEFVRMFNGRGATGYRADTAAPQAIYITDNRARAGIWSGEVWLPRDNKRVTFHELAHFQEKQHPDLAIELDKWKKAKADKAVIAGTAKPIRIDGDLPVYRLRDLTGNLAYDESEVAYKDDYLNAYMGKVYPATRGAYSEVWSMAVEHFADSVSMRKLWQKHPDLFEMVVGMSQMPP